MCIGYLLTTGMTDIARRPSIDEIEQLKVQVQREPGSQAFVRLGDSYLALSRPQDALEVGLRGLSADPDNLDGRLMVSRAHVALRQWKQAQDELLKLVKIDRNHQSGFTLLGEVLMRQEDFERALPVLQHAHNLDPSSTHIGDMLKRARAGVPLDPPPPIAVPQEPEPSRRRATTGPRTGPAYGSEVNALRSGSHGDPFVGFSDEPTRVPQLGRSPSQQSSSAGSTAQPVTPPPSSLSPPSPPLGDAYPPPSDNAYPPPAPVVPSIHNVPEAAPGSATIAPGAPLPSSSMPSLADSYQPPDDAYPPAQPPPHGYMPSPEPELTPAAPATPAPSAYTPPPAERPGSAPPPTGAPAVPPAAAPPPGGNVQPAMPPAAAAAGKTIVIPSLERERLAAPPDAAPAPLPQATALAAPAPAAKPAKKPDAPSPPPGPPPGVRPRVFPANKPKGGAREAMLNAADVGDYLNNLLTNGLLEVPQVTAQVRDYSVQSAKRWGHSVMRTFIFLFVLLVVGLGGGGYWVYRAEQQRQQDVVRRIEQARNLLVAGDFGAVTYALDETREALERVPDSFSAMAMFARAGSFSTLLYGMPAEQADGALRRARPEIGEDDPSRGDIVFAEAALNLASLSEETNEQAQARLADTLASLNTWLNDRPDDAWAQWLKGVALIRAGDTAAAIAALEAAESGGDGPVVATVWRADMLLDAGDLDGATARYEKALERSEEHLQGILDALQARIESTTQREKLEDMRGRLSGDQALALLGTVFVDIAKSKDPADIIGKLKTDFPSEVKHPNLRLARRLEAYKSLAFTMAYHLIEDYDQFDQYLGKAQGVSEPRFLARVALAQLLRGSIEAAGQTRTKIVWYGQETSASDPIVSLLDASLNWAWGLPSSALSKVGEIKGPQAHLVRGSALYDLGRPADAMAEFEALLAISPDDWDAKVWKAAASIVSGSPRERRAAANEFEQLSRGHKSLFVRWAHGNALMRRGQIREGREFIEKSIDDITPERPNPLAYRAHADLAQLDLAAGNLDKAAQHVTEALEQNPTYWPALGLRGRIELGRKEYQAALETLSSVLEEGDAATAEVELSYAEALVLSAPGDDDVSIKAEEALVRASDKGASEGEIARIRGLISGGPGAGEVVEAVEAPKKPQRKKKKRRRR